MPTARARNKTLGLLARFRPSIPKARGFAAPCKAFTHTPGNGKSLRGGKRLASLRQLEGRSAPLPPNLPRLVHAQTPRVALCHSSSLAYKMIITKSDTKLLLTAKLVVQITQLKLLCEINLDALAFRDVWQTCQTKPSFIWLKAKFTFNRERNKYES